MVGTILRLTIYLFFTLDTEILFTDENLIYIRKSLLLNGKFAMIPSIDTIPEDFFPVHHSLIHSPAQTY